MKILHIVPTYLPAKRYGGPIMSIHGLCKGLSQRGHSVHVFTTNINGPSTLKVPVGIPQDLDGVQVWYFSVNLKRLYLSTSMHKKLTQQIRTYDVVHLHSIYLWPTWAGARLAKRYGVPYILSPRGMLIRTLIDSRNRWLKEAWIRLIDRSSLEGAAAVHATSELEAQEMKKFNFRWPPLYVIPNGIDLDSIKIENVPTVLEKYKLKRPYVLFVGRISKEKGLDRFVRAMPRIRDVHFVIAGSGEGAYKRRLEQLIGKLNVRQRVIFIGPVYDEAKVSLMNAAMCLVLPSYAESFGMAALEAMAAGCPVVVTRGVGLAPIIEQAQAGVVVKGDPASFTAALNSLIGNVEVLKDMGRNGKKAISDRFHWPDLAKKMESVYKLILKSATKMP